MTHRICALLLPFLIVLPGCGKLGGHKAPPRVHLPPSNWHSIITTADNDRLGKWRAAWIAGLGKANAAGNGGKIDAQGALLKPDIALGNPSPPAGDYACHVLKMGAQTQGMLDYVVYPSFTCRISDDGGLLHFAKIDGSQRPVGTIYADDGRRMIFLGSMTLGDETRPLRYGHDSERDMVGILERVGPARWRIAFPYPEWESLIDVVELVPKGK